MSASKKKAAAKGHNSAPNEVLLSVVERVERLQEEKQGICATSTCGRSAWEGICWTNAYRVFKRLHARQ